MGEPGAQDRSGVCLEDLHAARVVTSHEGVAILSDLAGACDVAEPRDSLEEFSCFRGEDLHSRAGGDGKGIVVGRDVRDGIGGWRWDDELVLKGAPVALLSGNWRRARGQLDLLQRSYLGRHVVVVMLGRRCVGVERVRIQVVSKKLI